MKKTNPIPTDIGEYISYDPTTGTCKWIKKPSPSVRIEVGDEIKTDTGKGHLTVRFKKNRYLLHRVIWFLHYGVDPGDKQVDHKNRVRNDNTIANLRLVTHQQNNQNRSQLGISKKGDKWQARISVAAKTYYLGLYECPLLAGLAYQDVKSILHPLHSN